MRQQQTAHELEVKRKLPEFLSQSGVEPIVFDENITDKPDLVFSHNGVRTGVEVMRLDYQERCHWEKKDPGVDSRRMVSVELNVPTLINAVIEKKFDKASDYIEHGNLNNIWLVLHNDMFDLRNERESVEADKFKISRQYFEYFCGYLFKQNNCPYQYVLFMLEDTMITKTDKWYYLYVKDQEHKYKYVSAFDKEFPKITYIEHHLYNLEPKSYNLDLLPLVETKSFDGERNK